MNDINLPKIENFKEVLDKQKAEPMKKQKKTQNTQKLQKNIFNSVDTANFEERIKKVLEVKIYLKQNFHISDINESFMNNLNELYATSFLEKMGLISNTYNIKKLLKFKSLDKCDFQLRTETIRGKLVKVLHVFPNNIVKKDKPSLTKVLTNDEFEKVMAKTSKFTKQTNEDIVKSINSKELNFEEKMLFNPPIVENLINQAKEVIQDKMLFIESKGLIEQQVKGFDLSIQNLREKYLKPSTTNILKNYDSLNSNAKFKNFEKVKKNEIIGNKKFEYPFLEIDLNKDLIKEIRTN